VDSTARQIVSISSHLRTAVPNGLVSQKTPRKILSVLSKVNLKLVQLLLHSSRVHVLKPAITLRASLYDNTSVILNVGTRWQRTLIYLQLQSL
jgi:hypothetical protein